MLTSIFYNYNLIIFLIFGFDISTAADDHNETAIDPVYLIHGGYRPANPTMTKYIVSLIKGIEKYFGDSHYCTGTIITTRAILTAAHCVINAQGVMPESKIVVIASTPQRLQRTKSTQIIAVAHIIAHKKYQYGKVGHDIAVLLLRSDIVVDDITAAVAPLVDQPPSVDTECIILGWGRIFIHGPQVNDALYANVALSKCIFKKVTSDSIVCTDSPKDGPEYSDAGGPLFCNGKITGVVSFRVQHGIVLTIEDVYSNAWYYRSWILSIVNAQSPRSLPCAISSLPTSVLLCVLLVVAMHRAGEKLS